VRKWAPNVFHEWYPSGLSADDTLPWFFALGLYEQDLELRNAWLQRHSDDGEHWDQRVPRAAILLTHDGDGTYTCRWAYGISTTEGTGWDDPAVGVIDIAFDADRFAGDDYIVIATLNVNQDARLQVDRQNAAANYDVRIHIRQTDAVPALEDQHIFVVAYGPPPAFTDAKTGWTDPPAWVVHEVVRAADLNALIDNDTALWTLGTAEHDTSGTHASARMVPHAIATVRYTAGADTYSLVADASYGCSAAVVAASVGRILITFDTAFTGQWTYGGIVTCTGRRGRMHGVVYHSGSASCEVRIFGGNNAAALIDDDFCAVFWGY
jgi:hypothetical protein